MTKSLAPKLVRNLAILVGTASVLCSGQGVVSTVAGNGGSTASGDGGAALSASFHPDGLIVDSAGNIYIADQNNNRIRKVDPTGIITTIAGTGGTQFTGDGGPATASTVYIAGMHNGLAVDAGGNLYIADDGHHRIRKVDAKGIITTVAGNGSLNYSGDGVAATKTSLYRPSGVAVDAAGNLYIADTNNFRIRKVDTSGIITTIAGNGAIAYSGDGGPAINASFTEPTAVALDALGNIYVADRGSANVIRKIDTTGIIHTVAGNGTVGFSGDGGPAVNAQFSDLRSVTVDNAGNLYLSDYGNHRVRRVDAASGIVTTIAGNGSNAANNGDGGPPASANVAPADLAFDSAGNYYIADWGHNLIRKVTVGATVPGLSVSASSLYFSAAVSGNSPGAQLVTVSTTGTVPLGFKVTTSTSSGPNWLNVPTTTASTPTILTVSTALTLSVGTYKGAVTLTPDAAGLPVVTIPITFNVVATPPARPVITGVVNGASFQPGVTANALVTIQGTNLASVTDNWNASLAAGQLPTSLDGVTVLFSGKPGYLTYISPTQINLLVPDVAAGTVSVVVTNNGITPTGLFNSPSSLNGPAFFLWPGNQVVATRQDYSYAAQSGTFQGLTTVSAKPGDILILWGTGFGPTNPPTPIGIPVPADKIYSTASAPTVTINNVQATVYGAALASGYGGLYQVAIQVPASLADGEWPIVATVGGVSSPSTVLLSVQH